MQINPFFTPQAMGQYECIMFDEARKMISRFHKTLKRGEFVDITGEIGRLIVSWEPSITQHLHFGLNATRSPRPAAFFLEHLQTISCRMMLPPSLRSSMLGSVQFIYCAASPWWANWLWRYYQIYHGWLRLYRRSIVYLERWGLSSVLSVFLNALTCQLEIHSMDRTESQERSCFELCDSQAP